jgi:large repetitive protein
LLGAGTGGIGQQYFDVVGLKALITETNAAPSLALSSQVTSTPENGAALKVANIAVTDDGVGTNVLSMSGADAGSFTIQNGNELWFNGGADFEAKASYAVTVAVDDAAVGGTPDASQTFSLAITNVVGNTIVGKNGGGQTLTGTNEEDTITGGNGKDVLNGGGGNDVLSGGKGGDVLNGGAGNDTMDGVRISTST